MSEPTELRVRMVAMLSGLTRETTFYANEEYTLPAATAERYYDHGIADIIDPAWPPRPRLGDDEHRPNLIPTAAAEAADDVEEGAESEPAKPRRAARPSKETTP